MRSALFLLLLCCSHLTAFAQRPAPAAPLPSEPYGTAEDGTPLTWVVYAPPGGGPWPAVLVIHGGFWTSGSEYDAGVVTCAEDLAAAGYMALAISYRLAPNGSIAGQISDGRFPDQTNDVHLAVKAARADPRCNGRVGAVGGSAGASHVAWVAASGIRGADRTDVGVGMSGAYDLSDFSPDPYVDYLMESVSRYLGVALTDTAALQAASPAFLVDASVTPLMVAVTEQDFMPASQISDMATHLAASGATNYRVRTLPGPGHSFEFWPQLKDEAIGFLADAFAAPVPTPIPNPTPSPDALLNISTRAGAGTGDNVLIGGFILSEGGGSKRVIVRALGPSLAVVGVSGALANPSLQLFDGAGQLVASNDDWMEGIQAEEIIATDLAPGNAKEAALVATLAPGAYTTIVGGSDGTANIALVEVFDLDGGAAPQLLNLSTRGSVGTGDNVMIGGTIIGGTGPQTLVFRGLGPSLGIGPAAISDPLPNPKLSLIDSQGATVDINDNWGDTQENDIIATGLGLSHPYESAILATLSPGAYTVLLYDAQDKAGIGLLEVYNITSSALPIRK